MGIHHNTTFTVFEMVNGIFYFMKQSVNQLKAIDVVLTRS